MRNPFPASAQDSQSSMADDRVEKMRKEFEEIDENHDKHLSYEEIHRFLSKRAGKVFDKQLCQELFAKMDKNEDDAITVDEFIQAYMDAEDLIKTRMDDLRQQIRESTLHLQESQKQFEEASTSEELNEFGIMKGSQLTVQVIEAKNLKPVGLTSTSNPSVILTCDKQKIETRRVSRSQAPRWDEAFTFTIPKGDIDLKAVVQSEGLLRTSDFQGQVSIPLTLVRDQMRHDSWFELHGPKGNEPWQGSLRLGIQWIWSRKEYLAAIVKQWEDNINLDKQEVDHLQVQLKKLSEPFGFVEVPHATTSVSMPELRFSKVEQVLDDKIGDFAERALGADFNWEMASLVCVGVLITLGAFSMYIRPDFPNVTLGLFAFYFYVSKTYTSRHYKFFAYAILGLGVYDLIWFMIMGESWSASFSTVDNELLSIKNFSLWTSSFNSVAKVIILLVFWKNAVELQKRESKPI